MTRRKQDELEEYAIDLKEKTDTTNHPAIASLLREICVRLKGLEIELEDLSL